MFILLRAGLWDKEPDNLALFPLSVSTWENVYRLARRQTVSGIVYEGVCLLPDELMPPESLLVRWVAEVDALENRNRRMNEALAELYALFRASGLEPVLQKGQGASLWYENPLRRCSGDIDFCFPTPEAFRRAMEVVRGRGGNVRRSPDGSIHYNWRGFMVEHHPRLIDIANPFAQDFLRSLECRLGYRKVALTPGNGTEITVPHPLLNLVLISAHIMKHVMGWGIGLRQCCDMARACYCLCAEVDAAAVKALCHRVGIAKWSCLLHAFLVDCMGLSPVSLPYQETAPSSRPLLRVIMASGNFGLDARPSSAARRAWVSKAATSRAFLRNFRLSCAYMPREYFWMCSRLLTGQFKR